MDLKRFFVDPDIRKAETLPPKAFTSKEFLGLELKYIFEKSWLWAPADIPEKPGERTPFDILGRKMFMARDAHGTLRAFPNACTHKWNKLVNSKESGEKIICGYHGRQFALDGKFIFQPRCENLIDFPRECDSLKEYPLEKWFGVAFVNLGTLSASFDKIFYPVGASLSPLMLENMRPVLSYNALISGNWKYHVDNYIDELHLKFVHNDLSDETDIDSYETKIFDNASVRWVYAKNSKDGFRHPGFPKPLFGLWWHIFPNITINVIKGGLAVNAYEPVLDDPSRTNLIISHHAWDEKNFKESRKKWGLMGVDNEDLSVVAGVESVISHTSAPRGRFTPNGEIACHWFQRKIYEYIAY